MQRIDAWRIFLEHAKGNDRSFTAHYAKPWAHEVAKRSAVDGSIDIDTQRPATILNSEDPDCSASVGGHLHMLLNV